MRPVTGMFYVKDFDSEHPKDEKLVPAKFLIGLDGQPVVNPNSALNTVNALDNHYFNVDGTEIHDANPHNYLVVPVNYSIFTATDFAHLVNRADELGFSSTELMVNAFLPKRGGFVKNLPECRWQYDSWRKVRADVSGCGVLSFGNCCSTDRVRGKLGGNRRKRR